MRRATRATLGVVIAAGVAGTVAFAQGPVPTVAVTAGPTSVSVQAQGSLAAGPTRFEFSRQGGQDISVYVFLLNAGVSQQEFEAAMSRDDRTQIASDLGLAWIQASVSQSGSESRRAVTFTLRPGQTYYMLSEADEQDGSGPRQRGMTSFTTSSDANGATAPAPNATVNMRGLRFRGARTLPRNGVVRVTNNDGVPHFALAFPLRRGVTARRFGRAVRSSERAFMRVLAGPPYEVQNLISGGNTANDNEVRFPRAGRYGLVCFFDEHFRLGMYRVVRVR